MRALYLAAILSMAIPSHAWAQPAGIESAVSALASRSEANVKLDESRKPAEVLDYLGLQTGMHVLDMFGANQYWAEIMAPAVGANGHVTVWQPNQFLSDQRKADFANFAARQKNVLLLNSPFEQPALGTSAYDFIIMNLDYHDVYWESEERSIPRMDPASWLQRLYTAAKPGAVVGIIERAEGNPLLVEEFTRSALEAEGEDIPLTLQEQTMKSSFANAVAAYNDAAKALGN